MYQVPENSKCSSTIAVYANVVSRIQVAIHPAYRLQEERLIDGEHATSGRVPREAPAGESLSIKFLPRVQAVAVVGESDDSVAPVHQESYPGQQTVVHARRRQ